MPSFEFNYSDFPETDKIPKGFEDLLRVGKREAKVELFGRVWELATLEEWEYRIIYRKYANMDLLTRSYLIKLDILTNAIISCYDLKTNIVYEFKDPSQKVILRHMLLVLDPKIVNELYTAYQVLEESAKKEYEETFKDILEKVRSGFFVLSGKSSERSGSEM